MVLAALAVCTSSEEELTSCMDLARISRRRALIGRGSLPRPNICDAAVTLTSGGTGPRAARRRRLSGAAPAPEAPRGQWRNIALTTRFTAELHRPELAASVHPC